MLKFIKTMYTIGDYIHVGIVSIFCIFGTWAAICADNIGALLCSLGVILISVSSIGVLSYIKMGEYRLILRAENGDNVIYLKDEDIIFYLSDKTRFFREDELKIMVDNLIKFWDNILMVATYEELSNILRGTKVYIEDVKEFNIQTGVRAAGYAHEKQKFVSIAALSLPVRDQTLINIQKRVIELMKHELSHVIVCNYNDAYCGENGHILFKNVKTGF
jgi:hypothetical protein